MDLNQIINFEQVSLVNIDGFHKKAFIRTVPDKRTEMSINELEFCLANYGCDHGILNGKFVLIYYKGNYKVLCVGSPAYNNAIKSYNIRQNKNDLLVIFILKNFVITLKKYLQNIKNYI